VSTWRPPLFFLRGAVFSGTDLVDRYNVRCLLALRYFAMVGE
jgi:hypothetical protein